MELQGKREKVYEQHQLQHFGQYHTRRPLDELSVFLQGPEGPSGQRGPKGEQVEHEHT